MPLTRESLIEYFNGTIGLDTSTIDDQTPLFSSSLVDSFSMVELITFIESEGRFKINPTDVNLDNLDTIGRIIAFAAAKADN